MAKKPATPRLPDYFPTYIAVLEERLREAQALLKVTLPIEERTEIIAKLEIQVGVGALIGGSADEIEMTATGMAPVALTQLQERLALQLTIKRAA
jgi:hypothetical protein